jgi:hypothetical protein
MNIEFFGKGWKKWYSALRKRARKIYMAHRKEWEKKYYGQYVTINVETGEYYIFEKDIFGETQTPQWSNEVKITSQILNKKDAEDKARRMRLML